MITFLRKSRGVPYPDNGCSGSSWLVHFFSLIAVLLWLVPNTAGATDFYFKGSFNGWSHAETTYKLDASKTEQSFAFTGSDLYSKNGNSSTVNFNVYGVDGSNTWDIRPNTTDYNVTVNGGAVAMSSVNNGDNNGTSRGHSAVVNIENNANITYTFTFNRTGSDWNDCTVKVTSSSVSSSTTYSVVGADLTETNTNGSATFSGYTPTTSTDISFTIGSTTYGVSGTTSIDKAGTTTFSTSDNTLVSGGSQKLTLSPDFTYTFTLTDGKVTVVASSKSTPVTPTGTDAGLYLVGNFFNTDDNTNINYDRRIFKFTQQKDGTYSVEIPATLYANAQVLSVSDNGEAVYGPTDGGTSGYGLHAGTSSSDAGWPATDGYVFSGTTTWGALSSVSSKSLDSHYWHLLTRNNNVANYGDDDGTYTFYITLNNGVPSTWNVKHNVTRRVTYFLSDDADATAQPLENRRDGVSSSFNNEVKALVHFKDGRHLYYFVSNQLRDRDDVTNGETSGGYAEYNNTAKYGDVKPHQNQRNQDVMPTSSKLFLCGNNNEDWATSNHDNIANPNEGGIYFDKPEGIYNLIFNPTQGTRDLLVGNDNADHYGLSAEIKFNEQTPVFTSVAILGSAIPGTFDGTATEADGDLTKWHWASPLAMTYNESTRAYEVTIETSRNQGSTADSPAGWFRFEADPTTTSTRDNVKTWCDDATLANVPYPTATGGSNATEADPNQVTLSTKYADTENNIKFNREPGKYTIRFYAEKRLNGASYDDYYAYTITALPNSIYIYPKACTIPVNKYIMPEITVNTGDGNTTSYLYFTYDPNEDLTKVKVNSENVVASPCNSFSLLNDKKEGPKMMDKDVKLSWAKDLHAVKNAAGNYTVTLRAIAVVKNGDTYSVLPDVTDEVTYTFAYHRYGIDLKSGIYTKDLNESNETIDSDDDYSFMGINKTVIYVDCKDLDYSNSDPTLLDLEPAAKPRKHYITAGGTSVGLSDNFPNVYYQVTTGKNNGELQWSEKHLLPWSQNIILHGMALAAGDDNNKVRVWVDGQPSTNEFATRTAKYDVTYSTSEAGYKDAILQSMGTPDVFGSLTLYVKPLNEDDKVYPYLQTNVGTQYRPNQYKPIDQLNDNKPLTETEIVDGEKWYVLHITDLDDIISGISRKNGKDLYVSFGTEPETTGNPTIIPFMTSNLYITINKLNKVNYEFTVNDGTPGSDEKFMDPSYQYGQNPSAFPSSLGDVTNLLAPSVMGDEDPTQSVISLEFITGVDGFTHELPTEAVSVPSLKYFSNAIKLSSGKSCVFTVPAKYLTAGSKYTVQAVVGAVDDASTASLALKAGDNTVSTDALAISSSNGGNVSTDGRVDAFSSSTANGWKKLEAEVAEPETAQDLTVTFTAGTGGDIYITNLILLKDANTPGHFWTKAPTSEGTTSYDLSNRATANAFSFFDRGDNKNAIVFVNGKTVIGGAKDNIVIPETDGQYESGKTLKFSETGAQYNVASGDGSTFTIETLKLTDTNNGSYYNTNAFGFSGKQITAKNVTYDRTFHSGRLTICLPFGMSNSELSKIGVTKVYNFQKVDLKGLKVYWDEHDVSDGTTSTTAGTPYILEFDDSPKSIDITSLANGSLEGAPGVDKGDNENDYFQGVYTYKLFDKQDKKSPATWMFSGGSFKPTAYNETSFQSKMSPFRGYFHFDTSKLTTTNAKLSFAIWDGSTTTDIDAIEFMESKSDAPIYSISGQMVSKNGNRDSLPRGIYIQNNRKFVVK